MSDDEQTRPPWRTRPTGLRWRRHGLAGGIAAGLLLAGGGAGYAAGSSTDGGERVPAVEQVEDAGPDQVPPGPPGGGPTGGVPDVPDATAEVLPRT
ncbi:hypothetical protein ENKNEFLB_03460 [Nocardioides aquaticus]|uniref:Uncharacterized protein n=1 Tax=Nocardioides aquaticus TaxID=160826 RepID=A0ABX8EKJ9_9ACTN|nr:hypothetical protein [Nocardioides aquaticus]QVT81054.1 hypothetical protein ENKNEFLB_03460 [Nocardioides aquaticus]